MSKDFTKDGQPILFPEDDDTDVVEAEVDTGSDGGGKGPRQFAPLPALPDGDEVPIAMYAELATAGDDPGLTGGLNAPKPALTAWVKTAMLIP